MEKVTERPMSAVLATTNKVGTSGTKPVKKVEKTLEKKKKK